MNEEKMQLTRDNLISFLDFVAEKGLMKSETATGYKKACSIVLKILGESEASDLSKIDLESVFQRHRNLAAGRILPSTLKSYEVRTRAAINAFTEYTKDPSSWKSVTRTRTRKAKQTTTSKISKSQVSKPEETFETGEKPQQPSVHIDFQIHISPEATPEQIDRIFESMSRHFHKI